MREMQHPDDHPWVTTSVVDEEAIDHERIIGTVPIVGEVVNIRVAQRVDFDLLADPVVARPSEPRITMSGMFEMNVPSAMKVYGLLGEAVIHARKMTEVMDAHLAKYRDGNVNVLFQRSETDTEAPG